MTCARKLGDNWAVTESITDLSYPRDEFDEGLMRSKKDGSKLVPLSWHYEITSTWIGQVNQIHKYYQHLDIYEDHG